MKTRLIKILVLALAMVMVLTSCDAILGIFGGTPAHECESACEVCGKCTDESCTEDACADKCEGHKPAHTCESVCPDCGKCTDANCTEDACAAKCEGHVTTTLVLDPTPDDATVQQGPQNIRIGSFDIILSSEKSRIESKNVDFLVDGDYITHDARINFNGSPTMTPETSGKNEWENAVRFVASGKGKVTIFWQHAGKGSEGDTSEKAYRNVGLWDNEGKLIAQSNGQYDYEEAVVTTLEFDKAGTYYVGNVAHANYFFYVEVVHEGEAVELPAIPTYTVTFNSNEGSAVDPVTVAAGTFFKKPTDPTKDGHMFGGWYKDEALTEEFNFASDKVTADTILYAKWIVIESGTKVTYTLDTTNDLEAMAKGAKADGDTIEVGTFFTIHCSKNTKFDSNNKTFADEYKGSQRISFGGATTVSESVIKNCVEFTTKGSAVVKVWWVSGGEGRLITIYDASGAVVAQVPECGASGTLYISELELPTAGTYYLGHTENQNYIFKIEVVVTE